MFGAIAPALHEYIERTMSKRLPSLVTQPLHLNEPRGARSRRFRSPRGAYVSETSMNGCDGRLVRKGPLGFIEVRRQILEPYKKRFVIAHELGHFELHADRDQSVFFLDKRFLYWHSRMNPEEIEANDFAGELLLPEEMFKSRCSKFTPCFEGIDELAQVFRTTLTATAMQYIALSPYPCALICTERGERRWFKVNDDFPFKITLGPLDPLSFAYDFQNGGENPRRMQETEPFAWLDDPKTLRFVKEETRGLSRYGKMLHLIWVEPAESHKPRGFSSGRPRPAIGLRFESGMA